MNSLAPIAEPRATRFNPDARAYAAYGLAGGGTALKGPLQATTLETACAEATERWAWDRGDRLGIREIGQEDAPIYPFDKRPVDRLHIYAVRRSAPLRWELDGDLMRTKPVYRYRLEHICAVDLLAISRQQRDGGSANNLPPSDK